MPRGVTIDVNKVHLGAKPPLRHYNEIKAKVADFMDADKVLALPVTPSFFHWASGIKEPIPMFGNDGHGDCTWATEGQAELVNSYRVGRPEVPSLEAILEGYYATGIEQGLAPEDGRYPEGVLSYMSRVGLRQADGSLEKLLGYAAVDLSNRSEIIASGYLFGGLRFAVALPEAAAYQIEAYQQLGQRPKWNMSKTLPDGSTNPGSWAPGSWGGHEVYIGSSAYGGLVAWTWGHRVFCSYPWISHYGQELYAGVGADWIRQTAPSGYDQTGLINLLRSLNS